MDVLAILGLGFVFRHLRRRERGTAHVAAPRDMLVERSPIAPTMLARATDPRTALLIRAVRGLLLAGLLVGLALMPWPTAWAMSAALMPTIQPWRLWVIDSVDMLTTSLVCYALIEPLMERLLTWLRRVGWGLLSGAVHAPRLLWLLTRLAATQARISYWRCRNWRLQRIWRRHSPML